MNPFTRRIFVYFFSFFLLLSCSNENESIYNAESNLEIDITNVSCSELDEDILKLINNHRTGIGLNTLNSLSLLSGVAEGHNNYMIETETVSHDNFSQRAQFIKENTDAETVGENVAYGYSSALSVLNAWLNSEEHNQIIVNPTYTHFGISSESDNENRIYFTLILIKK